MLKENVPLAEAEAMVAKGARILEHKRDADNEHVCLVEAPDAPQAAAEPEEAPKKRGRPKASKG